MQELRIDPQTTCRSAVDRFWYFLTWATRSNRDHVDSMSVSRDIGNTNFGHESVPTLVVTFIMLSGRSAFKRNKKVGGVIDDNQKFPLSPKLLGLSLDLVEID